MLIPDLLDTKLTTNEKSSVAIVGSGFYGLSAAAYAAKAGYNSYGLANTLMQSVYLKPSTKNKKMENRLYAGQHTVPGPVCRHLLSHARFPPICLFNTSK